jgi:hypothetical protein
VRVDGRIEHNGCGFRKDRQQRLDEKKGTFHNGCHGTVESGFVPLLQWPKIGYSGVDEQNIERAKCLAEGLRHRLLSGGVARIRRDNQDVTAWFSMCRCQGYRVLAGYGNAGAFLEKPASRFKADPGRAACDECTFVLESVHAAFDSGV